jgi:hypothetical protein
MVEAGWRMAAGFCGHFEIIDDASGL